MIYIQSNKEKTLPHHFDAACALYGAIDSACDYKLVTFEDVASGKFDLLIKNNLFVGSVEFMREVFGRVGLKDVRLPQNSNRESEIITLEDALLRASSGKRIFIKPVEIKLFSGFVLDGANYYFLNDLPKDTMVYAYKPFNEKILSELRIYVFNNKIEDVRNYSGDPKISLFPMQYEYIQEHIIDKNKNSFPSTYTIDVAILNSPNRHMEVVEYNDMWSIGNYGVPNDIYLKMLKNRYLQIIKESEKIEPEKTIESEKNSKSSIIKAKPFLKWVGGKTQLLEEIDNSIPKDFFNLENKITYIEPFVGGGATLFFLLQKYGKFISKAYINDNNKTLMSLYKFIKEDIYSLIDKIEDLKEGFYFCNDDEERNNFYLTKRNEFNSIQEYNIEKASLLLFLNKTCFNGLYRVNRKDEFNVPFGKHVSPSIYDPKNLFDVHNILQNVEILSVDFEETLNYMNDNTLFYLDPPYKPISKTESFTSYSNQGFIDKDQLRLKEFCDKIEKSNNKFILSNSDLKNTDLNNNFFDDLYKDYKIKRVGARRNVNSNGEKRGKLSELLITNF